MCTGFCSVAFSNESSPNDQFQEIGEFVDKSVNVMINGAMPEVGMPAKSATGGTKETAETLI